MRRITYRTPGWDCIRNPCGQGGCGTNPGSSHGIHCEDWHYVVTDGKIALSLEVASGVFPESVPDDLLWHSCYPSGSYLLLHVASSLLKDDSKVDRPCELVEGGWCCMPFSGCSIASAFWDEHAGKDGGFVQPESFWEALEEQFVRWRSDFLETYPGRGLSPLPA